MPLQERLLEDINTAMRQGDELRRSVLRMVRAAVHNEEIARGDSIGDEGVIQVLSRMARQHRESIEAYTKANRPELAQREEQELALLQEYMPQPMSAEEITRLARQVLQEVGARGPSDKGRVMSRLMPQLKGQAEGAQVNSIVTRLLEEAGSS